MITTPYLNFGVNMQNTGCRVVKHLCDPDKMSTKGIFTMEFIRSIERESLETAKSTCMVRIESSHATPTNKQKAIKIVSSASSMKNLLLAAGNFFLAHQGMKVL